MTQYTYLPRTLSVAAACDSPARRAADFSRAAFDTVFMLDAVTRLTARRSFVFVVFFAIERYTPGRRRRAAGCRALPAPLNSARRAWFSAASSSYGRDPSAGRATGTD